MWTRPKVTNVETRVNIYRFLIGKHNMIFIHHCDVWHTAFTPWLHTLWLIFAILLLTDFTPQMLYFLGQFKWKKLQPIQNKLLVEEIKLGESWTILLHLGRWEKNHYVSGFGFISVFKKIKCFSCSSRFSLTRRWSQMYNGCRAYCRSEIASCFALLWGCPWLSIYLLLTAHNFT